MSYHLPVMVSEILEYMLVQPEGNYVDCTLGGGGHSQEILKRITAGSTLDSFDRDPEAIAYATERLKEFSNFKAHHRPFSTIGEVLGDATVDGILYDLGVSSHQLDKAERGFTFRENEKVDMRMNQDSGESAYDFLSAISEDALALCFRKNGDLKKSRHLAEKIKELVESKGEDELYPSDFRAVLQKVYKGQPHKHNDFLARAFQSIRMEVNEELKQIEESFDSLERIMKPGGRVCVLSYHSGEDRLVKNIMREKERECTCPQELPVCMCGSNNRTFKKVFNKPLPPTENEVAQNSRARSAKLRVYERV
ncbi:MAG: 16S rRNA (cytosine(1402)-N(4))-methyltransferase RsmH [Fibrobacterales bacterium]